MFTIYNNGTPTPFGSMQTVENDVQITNFALFSAAATGVELCLFDEQNQETRLPMVRTNNTWHLAVEGGSCFRIIATMRILPQERS